MKLIIQNIGKISEAELELKGITVIGGKNNSGKSTIGKSLYSILNSFYDIAAQIRKERILSIENSLRLVLRNSVYISNDFKGLHDHAIDILDKKDVYLSAPSSLKDDICAIFDIDVDNVGSKEYLERINIDGVTERIINTLEVSDKEILDSFISKAVNAEFNGQPLNIFSESEGFVSLKIRDKDLTINIDRDMISTNCTDYSLHTETIYIDDPFIMDDADYRVRYRSYTDHRMKLINKLIQVRDNISVVDEIVVEKRFRNIYNKLLSVCEGNIVRQKNGRLGYQINKERVLNVKNLSTGLKTFVIIQTLLMNGTIEENGVVILDEPEIHLHPEWQLLFAEIIVLLHKEFNIKILLNTHSPYFLRAIQVYAGKYEVGNICKYYLAEEKDDGRSYIIDSTNDVDKIFALLAKPLQKLEDEGCQID